MRYFSARFHAQGGFLLVGLALFCGACAAPAFAADDETAPAAADFAGQAASDDAREAADRIARTDDNHGQPFAIVDKRSARLFVFDADHRLVGATPVLLGLTPGDDAAPGMDGRSPASLRPFERTTPAGRFASEPGHNLQGEPIVWVDYGASLALHRLRPAPAREHRPERLASPRVDDKRVSLGCVVTPVAFYKQVVAPSLGARRGVIYILPESRPVATIFEPAAAQLAQR